MQFETDWWLTRGLETRRGRYDWNGLERGTRIEDAHLLFQFSLEGFGAFEANGKSHRLDAGSGFLTIVPSPHRYFLPPQSLSWTFFWFSVRHPYLVSRLGNSIERGGLVFSLAPDARLFLAALAVWQQSSPLGARDSLKLEELLFEWMFETERFCRARSHPHDERERWLQSARQIVMNDLALACSVEKLAREANLSRSHYSHLFKAATGLSPASWVQQVRLEEVARRLTHTDDKLQKIAAQTGYGDANHLCKVFRRYFRLSPNQFRRQMK